MTTPWLFFLQDLSYSLFTLAFMKMRSGHTGHSLRVKRRVKTVVRHGTFTQRAVNVWNGLPGRVVAAETGDKFKFELYRYLVVVEIEGCRDVGRTFW